MALAQSAKAGVSLLQHLSPGSLQLVRCLQQRSASSDACSNTGAETEPTHVLTSQGAGPHDSSRSTTCRQADVDRLNQGIPSCSGRTGLQARHFSTAPNSTENEVAEERTDVDVLKVVLQAIDNVTPLLEVRSQNRGGRVMYVPGPVHPKKQRSVAIRWLVDAAQRRKASSKASMAQCLAMELLLAYQRQGSARQRRDEVHKLAVQNRANLHLRWW